jgi:hypothetical protein
MLREGRGQCQYRSSWMIVLGVVIEEHSGIPQHSVSLVLRPVAVATVRQIWTPPAHRSRDRARACSISVRGIEVVWVAFRWVQNRSENVRHGRAKAEDPPETARRASPSSSPSTALGSSLLRSRGFCFKRCRKQQFLGGVFARRSDGVGRVDRTATDPEDRAQLSFGGRSVASQKKTSFMYSLASNRPEKISSDTRPHMIPSYHFLKFKFVNVKKIQNKFLSAHKMCVYIPPNF